MFTIRFRYLFFSLLFTFLGIQVQAQLKDDFTDGDLTSNPAWIGNTNHFKITNGQLQLFASVAGTSRIWLKGLGTGDTMTWKGYFKLDFSPSTQNSLRYFLQMSDTALAQANGYFFEIGETGSNDAIRFYKMENGVAKLIGSCKPGAVGGATAITRFEIKNQKGNWSFKTNYTGTADLAQDSVFQDNTFLGQNLNWFGIQCLYSETRKDKYYFDDIEAGLPIPDTTKPKVTKVELLSNSEVYIEFSENFIPSTALNAANYVVDNGVGNPLSITQVTSSALELTLKTPLQILKKYNLTISGVQDSSKNQMDEISFPLLWKASEKAEQFDVLINEIMADPTPVVGLPPVEYIELFKNTKKYLNLKDWSIKNGSTIIKLTDYDFKENAGSYVVLFKASAEAKFNTSDTLSFPAFISLSNEGATIELIDPSGNSIDKVTYSDDFYTSTQKREGGWSLERIFVNQPCRVLDNWTDSKNLLGGTPAQPNSVVDTTSLAAKSNLTSLTILSDTTLGLLFDQLQSKNFFPEISIDKGLTISKMEWEVEGTNLKITLNQKIQKSTFYELKISKNYDCQGKVQLSSISQSFGVPESPIANDLVINELLFNPLTGGADFVEIYNKSNKIVDLSSLSLAFLTNEKQDIVPITQKRLLLPKELIVITTDPTNIKQNYIVPYPNNLIKNDLPTYPDDEGNITLLKQGAFGPIVIDSLNYSDAMHYPLLKTTEGVSLERFSVDLPTSKRDNWNSASSQSGYATPTGENKTSANLPPTSNEIFFLPEKSFSPNGDGYRDFLFIQIKPDKSNAQLRLEVYDIDGRVIKIISKGDLLGAQESYIWNGITDNNELAPMGNYILKGEIKNLDGSVQNYIETFALLKEK